jgi:hypothetical protein
MRRRNVGIDPVRRRLTAALLWTPLAAPFSAKSAGLAMEVWTGPACSCCQDWIKHLEANGFEVTRHDGGNNEARARLGMPVDYGACHTGSVASYAVEGHVPAREIHRLLEERLDAVGLAVPAMPRGSPGMDGPAYRGVHDPYDVLLIRHNGSALVYQSYR